jgi:histidine kinase
MMICTLVDKSASIIDHIRNFSRRSGMNMRLIDLNRVVLDAIDLVNLQFKKHSVDIILVLNENISRMHGDRISIEQLIINLLLNARDAIMERQKTAEDGYTEGSHSHGTGRRQGPTAHRGQRHGHSGRRCQEVWSPFFTTKRRASGTGIGLSISSRILREHNATSASNPPGPRGLFHNDFPAPRERVGTVSSQQEA